MSDFPREAIYCVHFSTQSHTQREKITRGGIEMMRTKYIVDKVCDKQIFPCMGRDCSKFSATTLEGY